MYHINPIPKGMIPMVIQQYYCSGADCPTVDSLQYGRITQWEFASRYIATNENWEDYYLAWIVCSIAVVALLVTFAVQKVSFLKR